MGEDTTVKSVETTFRIIEALHDRGGAGVTELASALSAPKSTVHNHLQTLEGNEYVVNDDGTYRVGSRFLELGAHARDRRAIYEVARPEVDRIAEETGELSGVVVEEHGRGVFLHRAKGDRAVHVDTYAGKRIYLHGTALGKAVLANLPEERVDAIADRHGLPALTENTVTDRGELADELAEIRETGIAFDDEERLDGLRSVAGAVTGPDGDVLGAVSVAGPTSRLRDERFREELPGVVRSAVNVIDLNVTYS
ncbi:IclR family transcriptional regulator [Halobacterium litoreum]|uniref:IclR family transcriptional regulator n=1 Tax=Halobacterium litoreum TaxID=2039234 RepID=A0ABD5NBY6_9EURY|nr:IclR family transcriptional regulator [Halobacterium litoreum]UHH14320.1 IclR family transcriptional regulator [Halobacterium litoreum]